MAENDDYGSDGENDSIDDN